jgi:DnaK suppressor protein
MGEKNRYSDQELMEFRAIILDKLKKAQDDYEMYKNSITHGDGNDTQGHIANL